MGSKEKMNRFLSQQSSVLLENKLTDARRRVLDLLDKDSFVELGSQMQSLLPVLSGRSSVEGEGLICGYGQIDNRLVFVASQDHSVYQGAVGHANGVKLLRCLELAVEAASPFIILWDSAGIRADEGMLALDAVGRIYEAMLEAREFIPLISLVLGPCPGSLSILPTVSDLLIFAADKGGLFLQGPGITAAEENPRLEARDIGGATVHAASTGLATVVAKNSSEAIALSRRLFSYIPDNVNGFVWTEDWSDDPNRCELVLDELAGQIDDTYEMADVLEAVFDKESVVELYKDFATELRAGFARLGGQPLLFIANDEAEFAFDSATKVEKIISLAERLNYPLITFTDAQGYRSGTEAERAGISQVAARMMAAFSASSITCLNVIVGKAIGQAFLTFNSRSTGASMVFAWPSAEIGLLRPDSAVHLFKKAELAEAEDPIADKAKIINQYRNEEMSPDRALSQGLIDEVIRPSSTRPQLYSALQMLRVL